MKTKIISEHGYEEAMLGLSLSYNTSVERAKEVAIRLAFKQGGHNKYLESIYLWLDVTAPRFWWQEADTYRLSTKQSESTMHTILKKELTLDDFEHPIIEETIADLNKLIEIYKNLETDIAKNVAFYTIKNNLPEGFLQRRIWVMNYKTLQNIIMQRKSHKLPQWQCFIKEILEQVEHPEFLEEKRYGEN